MISINNIYSWPFTVDHKRIGMLYSLLGVWAGFIGLGLSILIRINMEIVTNNLSPRSFTTSL